MLPLQASSTARRLPAVTLALLAATLLTGCSEVLQGLELMAGITLLLVAVAAGVVGLLLLGLLIMSAYRLVSRRPSAGWGITALVVGVVELQALYVWTTSFKELWSPVPALRAGVPYGVALLVLGLLNLLGKRRS